jgi:hypothetical protein
MNDRPSVPGAPTLSDDVVLRVDGLIKAFGGVTRGYTNCRAA